MNLALVFSGGGARGAYQIGCWKALSELGLLTNVDAVYGTSVGAINAAAFIQNDLDLAIEIWNNLSYDKIFQNIKTHSRKRFSRKFYDIARQAVKEKGFDVSPLKMMLRNTIDEDAIRSSDLELGFVVFDWTRKRPKYMTKSEINYGELVEYIIASSTFPVFQPHKIGNKVFIDGGVYDNRPLAFCEGRLDLDQIICIDVTIARHFWPNKKRHLSNKIKFIRPSRLLGSPMAFDLDRIKRNIELGYRDTLAQMN